MSCQTPVPGSSHDQLDVIPAATSAQLLEVVQRLVDQDEEPTQILGRLLFLFGEEPRAEGRPCDEPLEEPDPVNHPPHYTAHPSGVECIEITEHMGFNVGNAVKYLWRADEKGNALEDLSKARWYVDRELQKRAVL